MDIFYAVAEPNRRSILEMLATRGEMPVASIAEKFQITSAAVSQHLKILREANLIRMEKRAQQRVYSINPEAVHQLEQWARQMSESYDRLHELLDK